MTLREFYATIGGDYEGVVSRLMMDKLVNKFVLKFLNDTSFATLESSLKERNIEEAFRAAHTLKGVCQNLSFTKLYESSHEITEALRSEDVELADKLFERVEADYTQTIAAIKNID